MRQLIIVTLLLTTSCPQGGPDECVRKRVSAGGIIEKHHPRVGGGPPTTWPEPDVSVPGEALSFRLIAPFTTCEGDALDAATIEVEGPNGEPVVFEATPVVAGADDHVETTVTFSPPGPGAYSVSVNFGAELGARGDSRTITPFPAADAVPVPLPAGVTCVGRAWPVSASSIACESENQRLAVIEADGGLFTFDGTQLVAVDEVLWSETDAGVLERREKQNGTFTVTNQWPGFGGPPVRGFHTSTVALRRSPDVTGITLVAVRFGGGRVERTFTNSDPQLDVYFLAAGTIQAGTQGAAVCTECIPDVVGLDSQLLWHQAPTPFTRTLITGVDRFSATTAVGIVQSQLGHYARLGIPALEPQAHWPLFVDVSRNGYTVLFDARPDGGIVTSVWPRARVLRIGPNFATVITEDGGIGVAPLPAN
ncbi:MAG: hypothetical protein JNM17_12700 [Archangium sp.]|nr:hypothetical protein [Archangium sp.]